MLRKTLLVTACFGVFCFADNFIIDSASVVNPHSTTIKSYSPDAQGASEQNILPQRVVIEDVNPSSELGQLVGIMLKNERSKKVSSITTTKKNIKKTVSKKKVGKKVVKKKMPVKKTKVVNKKTQTAPSASTAVEIKTEESTTVTEEKKQEANHNENNSSLKKISSSDICN